MGARVVSSRYLILGLLAHQPMSGYDIKRSLKGLSWLIGSPSFGSLYPALRALLKDGLVTVQVLPHQDKPPRKVYTLTQAGRQALHQWVNQPVEPDASLKAFVMRLVLAGNFSRAGLIAHLKQRRSQVADHRAALEQRIDELSDRADLAQKLAPDYGLAVASAELEWLDDALDQLTNGVPSEQVSVSHHPAEGV
jgi:DNA-binding PadR family transcriptional regulator